MAELFQFELGQVCSRLSSGKGISAKEVHEIGKYPVYGGNGLRGYTDQSNFEGECAIIGRQGAFCGNVRYFSGAAYMTEHAVVLCANEKNDTRYLAYLLSIMNLGRLSGQSAQPGLSVKSLSKQIVSLPSLSEQKVVADTLSALDEKIENNSKINHHLEQIAQTIFKSWFIEFEPFGGLMPDNWRQGVLSDIAPTIYSGGTPSTGVMAYWNGNTPWLSSGETRNHFIIKTEKLITQNGVDNSSTRIARRHDIVMASAGQGFTRGQTSLLLLDTYVNQSVIVMSGQNPLYLFFNLAGRYDELRAISDSSSSRGSITTKMLAQLPMLIPSNVVISEFTTAILPLVNQIENNLCESTRLVELRDTLLPRLMSGELSVADIDAK